MIAGGSGFLGSAIAKRLAAAGHETWILTRKEIRAPNHLRWDGYSQGPWSQYVEQMDAVVNAAGRSLARWPWTAGQKQQFIDSRVSPTRALALAIVQSRTKPQVFVQTSGINYYGLSGSTASDESTPPQGDFLAQLTVAWEAASRAVEEAGVRRVITRNAVVLDGHAGLLPIMALPVRCFLGGRVGDGRQAMCWIHITDYTEALLFLLENKDARGAYNLVSPLPTSSDHFLRTLAAALHRPYWLPMPALPLRVILGEMSVLVASGRYSRPRGLEELGYSFRFPDVESALRDIYRGKWALPGEPLKP